jgi:ribosomal protein S27AE
MNFENGIEGVNLDLKYCERCGGLWLRAANTEGIHCGACSAHFLALPKRGEAKSRRRRKKGRAEGNRRREESKGPFQIEYLTGVAEKENRI